MQKMSALITPAVVMDASTLGCTVWWRSLLFLSNVVYSYGKYAVSVFLIAANARVDARDNVQTPTTL